jgi:hypothetical protein
MHRLGRAHNLPGRLSPLTSRCLARFFAMPVDLLEKVAQHSDERRSESREQQDERHGAP